MEHANNDSGTRSRYLVRQLQGTVKATSPSWMGARPPLPTRPSASPTAVRWPSGTATSPPAPASGARYLEGFGPEPLVLLPASKTPWSWTDIVHPGAHIQVPSQGENNGQPGPSSQPHHRFLGWGWAGTVQAPGSQEHITGRGKEVKGGRTMCEPSLKPPAHAYWLLYKFKGKVLKIARLQLLSIIPQTHSSSEQFRATSLATPFMAQQIKNPPAMQETEEPQVRSLGWEDLLAEGMTTHSSILAWTIPRTEELGRLQSMGSQRVGHNWATNKDMFTGHSPMQLILRHIPVLAQPKQCS